MGRKKRQKCRKVQEQWLTMSERGEWVVMGLERQSPGALRRLLNLGLTWKGFEQGIGYDMIRQSHCNDHLGVSVDKMRVFDRRQTPAGDVHVSVRHDIALGDHGDTSLGKWMPSRDAKDAELAN